MKYLNDVILLGYFDVKMNGLKDNFLNFDKREKCCFSVGTDENFTERKIFCHEFKPSFSNKNLPL